MIKFDKYLNVIVGRNDVGKSTVLEALEIFFNNEQTKMDIEDLNVYRNGDNKVILTCTFEVDDEATIVIDSSVSTQLSQEYLLNSDGYLEIEKEWDCSKKSIGAKDLKTYIVANYPQIAAQPLACEKISELKAILKNSVGRERFDNTDKSTSSSIRKAIYSAKIDEHTAFELVRIDTAQEDAKNIWNSLKDNLPYYFLFKSDRVGNDKDAEVQNPMKAVTKIALAEMQSKIDEIIKSVRDEVEKIGLETINKLSELDVQIAQSLVPRTTTKAFDSLFSFDLESDDGIPLNKRGSGIRRLILLSYFRAEAEKRTQTSHNKSIIYAIEEPETSQHPDYQIMILDALQRLSQDGLHQIILTTHTPEIAKMVLPEQLIHIAKCSANQLIIEEDSETKIKNIVQALGVLPYAQTQTVIYVEGRNDVNFLMNLNQSIPELREIIDFRCNNISIVPLNGNNLIEWVNKNYFSGSSLNELHIFDNDVEKYGVLITEIIKAGDKRRYGWVTHLPEMENYIHFSLVEQEFDIDLKGYHDSWTTIDVPKTLVNLCMQNVKNTTERENQIKQMLNGKVSRQIRKEHLEGLEVWSEVEEWFKKISSFHNGTLKSWIVELETSNNAECSTV